MTENDFGRTPAGWYPDPMGLPQMRWWDSIGWTQDVAEARAPMVMRETAEKHFAWADDELPTRRERREQRRREREADKRDGMDRWRPASETLRQLEPPAATERVPGAARTQQPAPEISAPAPAQRPAAAQRPTPPAPADGEADGLDATDLTAESDFSRYFDWAPEQEPELAFASFSVEPDRAFARMPVGAPRQSRTGPIPFAAERPAMASAVPASVEPAPAPSLVSTGPVWAIALMPLVQLVLSLIVVSGFDWGGNAGLVAGIWILPYPLVLVLALCDGWALKNAGYHRPALWALALLGSPVYLLARAMRTSRQSGRGFTPLITWMLLIILQVGSVLAVPGLAISALPDTFRAQAEQSIASDASVLGAGVTVNCPATPPSQFGDSFTCTLVKISGTSYPITVSLQRLNGWIDWRIEDWGVPFLEG